jgi:choline dehydrogenase
VKRFDHTTDVVIVGAGSAGAVIASRATEDGTREVTLVEAGPDYPPGAAEPEDLRDGRVNSMRAHDWGLRHRPHPTQVLFPFPRGRVVGGSGAVNTCIAVRGHPGDYDEWASLGLREWSFAQCLPAFRRLERDLDADVDDRWHGRDGPIPIRRPPAPELSTWQAVFVESAAGLGFPRCRDANDPTSTGTGPLPKNDAFGVRWSAARGYLSAAVRARPHLRILPNTTVRRVLFEGRRAVGIEVERRVPGAGPLAGGVVETIGARTVVLTAGAIQTPAILVRSGVGPRALVERLGVELVADAPAVGRRLLDHPGTAIFFVPRALPELHVPVIQTVLRTSSRSSAIPNDVFIQPGAYVRLPDFPLPLVSIMAMVGKPRGIGRLEIHSADPRAKPRIHSELFTQPRDLAIACEALELAYLIGTSPEAREVARLFAPSERTLLSRERLSAYVPRACDSGYHPSGTVPMGADDAPIASAATDGRGRVRGVHGLIVADASLFPTVPTANTNLTVLMIGERFGTWLREGALED